jgi:non-specific serine/threonine protein kinase/serine/threonine-protein kinase
MVERLQLFQRVCEGVQHAHQKAVLHRDLKPGNVLVADVDGTPLPKIIDFGVAKATTQKLTEKTMYTAMGQLIGTPEYMSPEQAELTGEDVDTRTDVYSLGVILYELLVGALPFESTELRKAGFEGIRKMIREEDPPRPSTKLSTLGEKTTEIAAHRRSGPKRLSSQLKGDLDWIVMRCLEKDRNRRYGSPQELGQDIGRHLNYEPVQAGPPSAGYKARKFVRRNRLAVGIGAAAMIVLVGFTAMTVIQSSRIAAERDRANQEAEASERVSSFLAQMFADVDPYRMGSSIFDSLTLRARESRNAARGPSDGPDEPVEELRALLLTVNRSDLARDLLDEEILNPDGQSRTGRHFACTGSAGRIREPALFGRRSPSPRPGERSSGHGGVTLSTGSDAALPVALRGNVCRVRGVSRDSGIPIGNGAPPDAFRPQGVRGRPRPSGQTGEGGLARHTGPLDS